MAIVKFFEIRDRATFIPAIAIRLDSTNEDDRYLLSRAGFGQTAVEHRQYIMLGKIDGGTGKLTSDPYEHSGGARTMGTAHIYINKNFDSLESGAVICVETILGERNEPKKSERFE